MAVDIRPSVRFEVEKIIGVSCGSGNVNSYQVQWAPTWVSGHNLVGCEQLIDEFLQHQGRGALDIVVTQQPGGHQQQEQCKKLELPLHRKQNFQRQCEGEKRQKFTTEPANRKHLPDATKAGIFSNRATPRECKENIPQDKPCQVESDVPLTNFSEISNHQLKVEHTEIDSIHSLEPSIGEAVTEEIDNINDVEVTDMTSDLGNSSQSEVNPNFEWMNPNDPGSSLPNEFAHVEPDELPSCNTSTYQEMLDPDKNDIAITDQVVIQIAVKEEPENTENDEHCLGGQSENQLNYAPVNSTAPTGEYHNQYTTYSTKKYSGRIHPSFEFPHMYSTKPPTNNSNTCGECNKSFISRRDLERHERVHTGEKPFHCHGCEKKFSRKDTLVKHKRVYKFTCSECDKHFSQEGSLTWHMLHAHSNQPSDDT